MSTITIRDVPRELHEQLEERARKSRRSLNQEVIAELSRLADAEVEEDRLERAHARMEAGFGEIDRMRSRVKGFMTADEIDGAIDEGRN